MKRRILIFICVILLIPTFSSNATTYEGVWTVTTSVAYSGGNKNVTVIWVDLNDDKIRVDTVLADERVGAVDSLAGIVESASDADGEGVAGINGSFFQAYTDLQPLGYLVMDGETLHINHSGSMLTIDGDNNFSVEDFDVDIHGATKEQYEWPFNWYAWNINHFYNLDDAVMVFNSLYDGPTPSHDFVAIQVEKGIVTSKVVGGFTIPEEGFLLLTKEEEMINKFIIGESADFKMVYEEESMIDYDSIRTSIGAGPTLVKDGVIVLDAVSEGFTEDKIVNQAAQRSLVGVTSEGYLGMVSVSGVTMEQLAEIAINLGMVEAINLDGGASSGVYYNNNYIVEPGREISNGLVVRRLYDKPINIVLNDKNVYFDAEPYINETYNRTLVPLRKIAEELGATVGWDSASSSVTIERYDTLIKLQEGSTTVYVNDESVSMEVPLTIRESRSYVPVRFITEYFGGEVDWDGETNTVILSINDVTKMMEEAIAFESDGDYLEAINKYKEILELDTENLVSIKQLAYIYNIVLENKEEAIPYYELAFSLDNTDSISLNSLAWSTYSTYGAEAGLKWFEVYAETFPNGYTGYYGIGVCYASYSMEDIDKAITYFEIALEKGLVGSPKEYAENYILEHKVY